jgi:hypothetical protein
MPAVIILLSFGLATGIIGRAKGSSFFIWFLVGAVLPFIGLIAVVLYRNENAEPERACPNCGAIHKIHVQVCTKCGLDMDLPPVEEVRSGPAYR